MGPSCKPWAARGCPWLAWDVQTIKQLGPYNFWLYNFWLYKGHARLVGSSDLNTKKSVLSATQAKEPHALPSQLGT